MKKTCESRKPCTKPLILRGSRQVVESAIDASKSSRNRSWDASARAARRQRRIARQRNACDEDE